MSIGDQPAFPRRRGYDDNGMNIRVYLIGQTLAAGFCAERAIHNADAVLERLDQEENKVTSRSFSYLYMDRRDRLVEIAKIIDEADKDNRLPTTWPSVIGKIHALATGKEQADATNTS